MDPRLQQLLFSHHLIYISQISTGRIKTMTVIGNKKGNKLDRLSDWSLIELDKCLINSMPPGYTRWSQCQYSPGKMPSHRVLTAGNSHDSETLTYPVGEVWSPLRCGPNLFSKTNRPTKGKTSPLSYSLEMFCVFPMRESRGMKKEPHLPVDPVTLSAALMGRAPASCLAFLQDSKTGWQPLELFLILSVLQLKIKYLNEKKISKRNMINK